MTATIESFKKAFKHKLVLSPYGLQDELKKLLNEASTRLQLVKSQLGDSREHKRQSEKIAELQKLTEINKEWAEKVRTEPEKTTRTLEKARDQAREMLADLQPETARLFNLRREPLVAELAKCEQDPKLRTFVDNLNSTRNHLSWAADEALKGDFVQALLSLDVAASELLDLKLSDKSGQQPATGVDLSDEETAWQASRLCLTNLLKAAEQSLTLLVEVFGADDVARKRGKRIESLKKNLAKIDELASKHRKRATRIADRLSKDADKLVKDMQPDADKIYQQRRAPVKAAINKLLKHPQYSMLTDEFQTAASLLKEADGLAKAGTYKSALQKLTAADNIASTANSVDLSKPDKKAIFETLKKKGDPAKALAVAAVTTARGTATKEDAVAVAEETAKLPVDVLRRLNAKGATVVAARGNVPDVIPSLKGVHPNGWPPKLTWDNVPGVYDPATKQIVAATRAEGKGRKVLETGKVIKVKKQEVSHGSFSVVLHEAGHGLDFNGFNDGKQEITAELSSKALFTGRRNKDVSDNKIKAPRDNYYLQNSPWGERETFAESTARYFGGDGKFSGNDGWPETAKFWAGKPWGIGSI